MIEVMCHPERSEGSRPEFDIIPFDTNRLICGDNLVELQKIDSGCIDLVYIDPPFFSKRNYEAASHQDAKAQSFVDKWEGGLNEYLDWMRLRLKALHRALKQTGSFYLHCDWHAGHYLKVICDEIFGYEHFQNEIVWCYRTGGASKKRWSRKHDSILFYTKSDKYTFNVPKERIYYKKRFFTDRIDERGQHYADVQPVDWWQIKAVINLSNERLDYPTQKPEALLEKIILASSNEGDIVLDAFCGSGTTLAVAQRLGRRWIGIDISESAIEIAGQRVGTGSTGVTARGFCFGL